MTAYLSPHFQLQYIDGQWRPSTCRIKIPIENPADGQLFAFVPDGSPADADFAVEAASRAFPQWRATPLEERISIIRRVQSILEERREIIADLELHELGAPIKYARTKMSAYQLSRISTFAGIAESMLLQRRTPGADVFYEPYGVVAAITPWNFPLGQAIQKVIPALLTGNTVVLKPSELAPLTAYLLAEAFDAAGLPSGVFNLVCGRGECVGEALTSHPLVNMISFTGSTETGRRIAIKAAERFTHCTLELGGKSPAVWLSSLRDFEGAARSVVGSVFSNAGQTCTALSRLIVPQTLLPEAHAAVLDAAKRLPLGSPKNPSTKIGPVVSRRQFDRVADLIRSGIDEGAEIIFGGLPKDPTHGYFITPTIFSGVTNDMRIAREEIFGPVLCIIASHDDAESLRIANDTPYGLSAAVWGAEEEARRVAMRINAGNVFINGAPRDLEAPFGGYKASGWGRESGQEGLLEFTQAKSIFSPSHSRLDPCFCIPERHQG